MHGLLPVGCHLVQVAHFAAVFHLASLVTNLQVTLLPHY